MTQFALSPRVRTSPFHRSTIDAGLSAVTVYNHMMLPAYYGDFEAEYDRLVNGVALWDVASERQVQLAGPDADACAQYLTARDLTKMKEGQGKYVAMCDHDGLLLNDPVLMKLSDGRYWFSLADSDMLLWCKAVAAERGFDVEVTEPDVSPLAVQGPKAERVIVDLFDESVRSLKYFWFTETELDGIPLVLCRSGWSKQGGFELFLQDGSRGDELWARIMAAGEPYGIGPGAPNPVERVESGLLSYGGDTEPDSNPFEAGMARFVDVDCEPDYIGKAALQRMLAEGGPKRLLVGVYMDSGVPGAVSGVESWPLLQRTPIWVDTHVVGSLSAIAYSPRLERTIGIAQIERRIVELGVPVRVETPIGTTSATVTDLPFIR